MRNPAIGGEIPAQLRNFTVGEVLPWKGTTFTVGKIIGGDFPMLILLPSGLTHGAKLRILRKVRDVGRAELEERAKLRGAAVREALR